MPASCAVTETDSRQSALCSSVATPRFPDPVPLMAERKYERRADAPLLPVEFPRQSKLRLHTFGVFSCDPLRIPGGCSEQIRIGSGLSVIFRVATTQYRCPGR